MGTHTQFWKRILEVHGASVHREILKVWLGERDGQIETRPDGWPVGRPYREMSAELASRGVTNGKGQPYHPYHLFELIVDGVVEGTYNASGYEGKDPEARTRLKREVERMMRLRSIHEATQGGEDEEDE